MSAIKAKQLVWQNVKPRVFEDWAWDAEIRVITANDRPAYYRVHQLNGHEISARIWHGNRGHRLESDGDYKCYNSLEEGKADCQKHYNRLVSENAEEQ